MSNRPDGIPVIYIVGTGHSGSTLLDLILGSHTRIESVGELVTFNDYFAAGGPLAHARRGCTCGRHVEHCPYWERVRGSLGADFGRGTHLPMRDGEGFAARNTALLGAILAASGKSMVCDSSKDVRRLASLLRSDRFDCRVIHLVRDGRAVAYSYERLARAGTPDPVPWDCYDSALRGWAELNERIVGELTGRADVLRVRYEDLAADPGTEMVRVLDWLGLPFEPDQLCFWQFTHHNLCGNRMRMRPRPEIKQDDEYLRTLNPQQWERATVLVSEALRDFGYPLGPLPTGGLGVPPLPQ